MISSALNLAAGSLKIQQKAMDVVANNMANVNTPGYSRQSSQMSSAIPIQQGGLNFGRGVQLSNISRTVDPIINQAMLKNNGQQGYWQNLQTGLSSIETTFGSLQSTGLSAAIDDFFAATQQMANAPQDVAQKINVSSKSVALATRLSDMSRQLTSAQTQSDAKITQDITSVNNLLDQVGALNTQILKTEGASQGVLGAANDLRDQRDQAIRDISKFMPIQQVKVNNGGVLLQSMGGDLLVQDNVVNHLGRSTTLAANGFQDVVIVNTQQTVTGITQSGTIGGSIALRDDRLGGYLTKLDSIAVNLAFGINQANASGVGSTQASLVTSGQGALNQALPVNDVAQKNPFSAQMIVPGSFTIHAYDSAGAPLTPLSQVTIPVTATSTMASIATAISGSGLGVTASVDVGGRLVMNAGVNKMGFANDTSNFLAAYQINNIFQGTNAASLQVSAAVQADAGLIATGKIDPTTSFIQTGDNQAALQMMRLQNAAVSFDGSNSVSLSARTSTLSTIYGNDVALATQQTSFHTAEASSLMQQRQALSGVNVDEELVNMIKYQRSYEASAKIIQTSNQMLSTLMGLIR
ncbi:MAG: flagellar hook-associated protein FlgK [Mariprofundaceae bacterium]|nr:flagellar hook-associated protein FlgK [Mariprofundaceae bacterium]